MERRIGILTGLSYVVATAGLIVVWSNAAGNRTEKASAVIGGEVRPWAPAREGPLSGRDVGTTDKVHRTAKGEIRLEGAFRDWWEHLAGSVEIDAEECAVVVAAMVDPEDRANGLQLVFYHWGAKDYDRAKEWMEENLSPKEIGLSRDRLLAGLVEADPARAKIELAGLEPSGVTHLALSLVQRLFADDPREAEAWAIAALRPVQTAQALESIGREWLRTGNVNEAVRLLDKMAYGASRNDLILHIGERFFRTNPDEAFAWLEGLPAADRDLAAQSIMATWAKDAPVEAAAHALETYPRDRHILEAVISTWAGDSPQEAVEWVGANIAGEEEAKGLNGRIFQQWGMAEPAAAAAYVAEMKKGGGRALYLALVTSTWVGRNPEAAGEWLTSVGGPDIG